MIKHIFTLIWNNRRQNIWLIGGLFVISVCLWYAVDYIYAVGVNQQKSLGFDWHNVYYLKVGALEPESDKYVNDSIHTTRGGNDFIIFLDRLKHHPAVESVCFTDMHRHYVWMNRGSMLYVDTLDVGTYTREVNPDYFRVFRVKSADGSSPEQLAAKATPNGIIITENIVEKLFPQGSAVGQEVKLNNDTIPITAVCENQKYNEYTAHYRATYQIFNINNIAMRNVKSIPRLSVYIRVRSEADHTDFIRDFRKEMHSQLMIGNLYLEEMTSMKEVRDEHLKDYRNDLYTYLAVALFFLMNVFLAVLGTFWFRTEQRKGELGLRVALGSSRMSMRSLLLNEGIVLLSIAFIPAMVVGYTLGHGDVVSTWPVEFTMIRFIVTAIITYVLLLLFLIVGILFPARRAMKIEPAIALREE